MNCVDDMDDGLHDSFFSFKDGVDGLSCLFLRPAEVPSLPSNETTPDVADCLAIPLASTGTRTYEVHAKPLFLPLPGPSVLPSSFFLVKISTCPDPAREIAAPLQPSSFGGFSPFAKNRSAPRRSMRASPPSHCVWPYSRFL